MAESRFAKIEVTASSVLAASRKLAVPSAQTGEDKLIWVLIGISTIVHLIVLVVGPWQYLKQTPQIQESWELSADLITDDSFLDSGQSSLPDAAKAEEVAINERALPQITKKFTVEQPKEEDEGFAEKVEEKPKDDIEKADKKVEAEKTNVKGNADDVNKLKKDEALKRLALEKLRQEEKFAKKTTAPETNDLARIAANLRKERSSGAGGLSATQSKLYAAQVNRAIRQNYSLPEAYNLRNANIHLIIQISVDERGGLLSLDVAQPSTDPVFDELALGAVRASVPLPQPPKELAGKTFLIRFSP